MFYSIYSHMREYSKMANKHKIHVFLVKLKCMEINRFAYPEGGRHSMGELIYADQ